MTDPVEVLNNMNQPKPGEFQFATRIPDRRPEFKIHRLRGQATSALNYRTNSWWGRPPWYDQGCQVFEMVDGKWEDRTQEFKAGAEVKEAEKRKAKEERERLRSLCPSPCEHCTVRKR